MQTGNRQHVVGFADRDRERERERERDIERERERECVRKNIDNKDGSLECNSILAAVSTFARANGWGGDAVYVHILYV